MRKRKKKVLSLPPVPERHLQRVKRRSQDAVQEVVLLAAADANRRATGCWRGDVVHNGANLCISESQPVVDGFLKERRNGRKPKVGRIELHSAVRAFCVRLIVLPVGGEGILRFWEKKYNKKKLVFHRIGSLNRHALRRKSARPNHRLRCHFDLDVIRGEIDRIAARRHECHPSASGWVFVRTCRAFFTTLKIMDGTKEQRKVHVHTSMPVGEALVECRFQVDSRTVLDDDNHQFPLSLWSWPWPPPPPKQENNQW
jgi:hypothetical protein